MIFKKILIIGVFLCLFTLPVSAQSSTDEFLATQKEKSGASSLYEALPEETADFFRDNGIELDAANPFESLTPQNVFGHIWGFLQSGARQPLTAGAAVLAVILISAALTAYESAPTATSLYATSLCAAAAICLPVFSVLNVTINALKGLSVFMSSFVPVFAVVVASSGAPVTSASMSGLLLLAAQAVSYISNFLIAPLMGGYLAISVSASVSPLIAKSGIADGIKRLCFWVMSLLSTVFIGILSIQTAISASADSLSVRTAKFIIGSAVPVAGTALSEALTTVTASMGMLKTSVGIYGVVACAAIFLPLLIELLLWRLILTLCGIAADLFAVSRISQLLKSIDTVMSVLIGVILLTGAMFIISLTVIVSLK